MQLCTDYMSETQVHSGTSRALCTQIPTAGHVLAWAIESTLGGNVPKNEVQGTSSWKLTSKTKDRIFLPERVPPCHEPPHPRATRWGPGTLFLFSAPNLWQTLMIPLLLFSPGSAHVFSNPELLPGFRCSESHPGIISTSYLLVALLLLSSFHRNIFLLLCFRWKQTEIRTFWSLEERANVTCLFLKVIKSYR